MKKSLRIVAVVMVALMLCLCLASCGKKLSGKYSADLFGTGTTMTFDGSNAKIAITVTLLGEVASMDAKYEIKDDKISFDIADEEEVTNDLAKKVIASLEQPVSFEEGEDYIKIGDVKYTKQAD
jgi:uncharacterized lipoprotein YehR (DUF1307 family)